jgi:hypothetical protein
MVSNKPWFSKDFTAVALWLHWKHSLFPCHRETSRKPMDLLRISTTFWHSFAHISKYKFFPQIRLAPKKHLSAEKTTFQIILKNELSNYYFEFTFEMLTFDCERQSTLPRACTVVKDVKRNVDEKKRNQSYERYLYNYNAGVVHSM